MLLILSSIGPKIRTFVTIRSGYHWTIIGPSVDGVGGRSGLWNAIAEF
ncbi:MAG: hypothetical protein ACO331_07105 [Prochlorothrix sp.]